MDELIPFTVENEEEEEEDDDDVIWAPASPTQHRKRGIYTVEIPLENLWKIATFNNVVESQKSS